MPGAGTSAQGAAIGAAVGGPIGTVVGGILGSQVAGLFSHKASGSTLNRTYNEMRDWARDLVTLAEFTALEQNRQAGFFANDVVVAISDQVNTLQDIENYRNWSNAHYRPEVKVLVNRLLDYKAKVITGAVSTPSAAGAVTQGNAQTGTVQAPPTTPGTPTQAGFPIWAIVILIGVAVFLLFKGFK